MAIALDPLAHRLGAYASFPESAPRQRGHRRVEIGVGGLASRLVTVSPASNQGQRAAGGRHEDPDTEVQRDALSFPSEGRFQLSDVRNQGIARLGECVECCGVAAFVRMRVLRLLAKGLLNCFLG